jgi:CheY-like chemotaxis protein
VFSKILWIEDDPDIQTVAQMALEEIGGFTLVVCNSGAEAIEKVRRFVPDIILLDVIMPEMDGPTTLLKLREIETMKDIPVVFITAKVMPSDVEHYQALGAADVIAKPFELMTLAERVQEIWSASRG